MSDRTLSGLDIFLREHPFHCEFHESWPIQGKMLVRIALASKLPPQGVRSSILTIVIHQPDEVLCLYPDEYSGNISQLLIGGRSKDGETPGETVIREVKEETGWVVAPMSLIGFRHFHQLDSHSEKSDRPYPDFVQPIFASRAVCHESNGVISEDFLPSRMVDYTQAKSMIPLDQHPLLLAAIQVDTAVKDLKTMQKAAVQEQEQE